MDNTPIPTFPIPAQEASLNQLADHMEAINQGIASTSAALQGGLVNQLTPIQQGYDSINRRIMNGMNSMMRPINAMTNSVDNALYQQMTNLASEIGVQTTLAEQAVSQLPQPSVPLQPPPTGQAPSPNALLVWNFWANCTTRQAAATWIKDYQTTEQFTLTGWTPVKPPQYLQPMTAAEAQRFILANMLTFVRACR